MSNCKPITVIKPKPPVQYFGRTEFKKTCDKIKKVNFNHRKVK